MGHTRGVVAIGTEERLGIIQVDGDTKHGVVVVVVKSVRCSGFGPELHATCVGPSRCRRLLDGRSHRRTRRSIHIPDVEKDHGVGVIRSIHAVTVPLPRAAERRRGVKGTDNNTVAYILEGHGYTLMSGASASPVKSGMVTIEAEHGKLSEPPVMSQAMRTYRLKRRASIATR
jgi:hypothetical protein